MNIDIATAGDGIAIAALHKDCFEVPWEEATMQEFIMSDLVLVSRDALTNKHIGFLIVRHLFDEAEILSLGVAKAARQSGVAASLLMSACDILRGHCIQTLFLEVAGDNCAAVALYHRAGFIQIGERKAYYSRPIGPPIDALVMSVKLDASMIAPSS